jgi:TPP-dependent pyruvate/acetoin dehydrogenase alpha subunit
VLLTARLTDAGALDGGQVDRIEAEVASEVEAAVAFAEAGTLEPVEHLTRFVYSDREQP